MSALGLTVVDPLVVVIVFVSAMYATYRGFVSETLSIFAWAAAAFATLFFGPKLAPVAKHLFSTPLLGVLIGYAAIFLVVLIPLSFMSVRFAEQVKRSQIGTLDRSLGFAFGVVRGLAIIGLAYIAFSSVIRVKDQPDWIARAKLLPVIQISAEGLLSLVPDQHLGQEKADIAQPQAAPQGAQPAPKTADVPVPAPRPAPPPKKRKKAYGAQERRELDRLIETTGGNGKP